MKNQGISLISLIITIIVIIILAAIVIFSGMDTPERAQLADFMQQVTNVDQAVKDQIANVSVRHTLNGETRNMEQVYYEIAYGEDCEQYGKMQGDDLGASSGENTASGEKCQNIKTDVAKRKPTSSQTGLGLALPKVREHDEAWYITEDGQVFNATGYVTGGRTYFTPNCYYEGELAVAASTNTYEERAIAIAAFLTAGNTGAVPGLS